MGLRTASRTELLKSVKTSEKASTAEAASVNSSEAAVVEEMAAENEASEASEELVCTLAGVEVICFDEVVSGDRCSGEEQGRGSGI